MEKILNATVFFLKEQLQETIPNIGQPIKRIKFNSLNHYEFYSTFAVLLIVLFVTLLWNKKH